MKKTMLYLVGMIIVGFVFFKLRMPLLNEEASLLFWDSDYAIFVRMAEDIKSFKEFPIYYWGAGYLGPFNNIFMALTATFADLFGFKQSVPFQPGVTFTISPLVATFSTMLLTFLGTIFWGFNFLKLFTVLESLVATLLLSLGGYLMMKTSVRPLGPEVAYFLGALSFWQGFKLAEKPTTKNQFLFGLVFGFCWWMNQITVFTLTPVIFYFVAPSKIYKSLRNNPQVIDRALLRWERLGIRRPQLLIRAFLKFLYPVAFINLLLGIWVSLIGGVDYRFWGIKVKINNGFSPIKTSLLIFGLTQFLLWITSNKENYLKTKEQLFKLKYFLTGALIGFSPVIIGKLFKIIKPFPAPRFQFIPIAKVPAYYERLISDFFPKLWIGVNKPYTSIFFALLIVTVIYSLYRNKKIFLSYIFFKSENQSIRSLLWAIPLFNIVYILICERSRDQYAYRYAILTLPIVSIFVVTSFRFFEKKLKVLGIPLSVAMVSIMAIGNYQQGQETISWILAHPKPHEKLEKLLKSDCDIYFSNYWNTYIFEYFTQNKKQFGVIRGQDRTPDRTKKLKESPSKKCNLDEQTFEISSL
ncbi:MAG: hypothetical protein K9K67_00680 [Bacteriovoracaceae bacterium]|nr:hypothetical protein [Bacteriovoracaceae bacterium]